MELKKSVNNRQLLAAIVIFAAIVPSILMTAPAIASQLAKQLQLNEAQIGYLFMAELGAMSLATLPAYWWISRFNWHRVAKIAIIIFCLGNILSAFTDHYLLLIIARFITASAGGALMILCMSSASYSQNPSKTYGLWVLGQLTLGAVGLFILPHLFALFGLKIVYILLAVAIITASPLLKAFPKTVLIKANPLTEHNITSQSIPFYSIFLGIIGVLFFYIGLSGIWTFIGNIAEKTVLISPEKTGEILSIATLLGIVGAALASMVGHRLKTTLPLWVGYLAIIVSVGLLIDVPSLIRFIIAAFIFKFMWTFVLPFILGTVSALDRTGKLMNTVNLVMGGGMAIGPAIAGILINYAGGIQTLIIFSIAILFLSMGLILFIKKQYN